MFAKGDICLPVLFGAGFFMYLPTWRLTIHIQIGISCWVIFNIYLQLCNPIARMINLNEAI